MNCSECNKKPELPPSVLEIVNQCDPVLFHKVIFPASLGDDTTVPPDTLNYKNVLLVYEANEHAYLYSSDGAATMLPTGATDLTAIKEELAQHGIDIENLQTSVANLQTDLATETTNREQADVDLQTSIAGETQDRQDADTDLQSQINTNKQDIASLNATVTTHTQQIGAIETNLADISTELQTDIANEALAREEADDGIQSNIDAINSNLNQEVEKETDFTTDSSTVTVQHTKVNLSNNDTNVTTDPLPVANETQAGVMNSSMFQALQNNSENIDSILNGAVALTDIPAEPTQEELTTAWETATGKTSLINRASIYDITNSKVWYYYDNISQWEPVTATGEGEVSVSIFTNTTPGILQGSEEDGQIFAEPNGKGSVNGWDAMKHDIENIVELLDTNPIPKLYDNDSTATDGANTANYIHSRLGSRQVRLGSASATGTSTYEYDVAIGASAKAFGGASGTVGTGGVAIGAYATAGTSSSSINHQKNVAIGNYANATQGNQNVALGAYSTTSSRNYEVSIGSGANDVYKTRFLANVREGVLDTDAVNVKQMKDYVAATPPLTYVKGILLNSETDIGLGAFTGSINGRSIIVITATPGSVDNNLYTPNFSLNLDGNTYPVDIINAPNNQMSIPYPSVFRINLISIYRTAADPNNDRVQAIGEFIRLDTIMTSDEFNAAWETA